MTQVDPSLQIEYTKFLLPNGIKCVLYQRNEIHSVNLRVTVNVGALDETEETSGISHFMEHVGSGDGTRDFPTWEMMDDFKNQYSGSTNAYTTFDHTQFYGTFPHQYLEQAIYYLSQEVLHPLIKEEDVEKERTIILDELKRYEDDIHYQLYTTIRDVRFTDNSTPFSFEIIGNNKTLNQFSRNDIYEHYQKYYIPENMEVYVVGNMDIEQTKEWLAKYFYTDVQNRKFYKRAERIFKKEYPDYSGFSIRAMQKLDIDQYYLALTFPAPEFDLTEPIQRYRLGFLSAMTASSQYSRSILWKRLREELNLVYGVHAFNYSFLKTRNFFGVYTSFNKDHLKVVMRELYDGLNKIKDGAITDEVFKARQKKLLDTQLMQLDKPSNVLEWIVEYEDELETHGKGTTIGEYLQYVRNETFENIIKMAEGLFDWEKANIVLVSKDNRNEVEHDVDKIWAELTNGKEQLKMNI